MPDPYDAVLLSYRRASRESRRWTEKTVLIAPGGPPGIPQTYRFPLGGSITVIPSVLNAKKQKKIYEEVLNCNLFRTYKIQGQKEPRTHFLLHKKARDKDPEVPGYRYGVSTMRAHPLRRLPKVKKLSKKMKKLVKRNHLGSSTVNKIDGTMWNVGIDVLFYRSGMDSINRHKDNNQNESIILTVILYCPTPRRILIESDNKLERYELFLKAGDAYCMDGEMQVNYTHAVPKVAVKEGTTHDRLAIVMRRGVQRVVKKDSGTPLADLSPRINPPREFGRITGLQEGLCYEAETLKEIRAHRSFQCGVSGNKDDGCDAIKVSSPPISDCLFEFTYAAALRHGGYALITSAERNLSIRVFRSSRAAHTSIYAPPPPASKTSKTYRYDGLYTACRQGKITRDDGTVLQTFSMTRVQTGRMRWENELTNREFISTCEKLGTLTPEACAIVARSCGCGGPDPSTRSATKRDYSAISIASEPFV